MKLKSIWLLLLAFIFLQNCRVYHPPQYIQKSQKEFDKKRLDDSSVRFPAGDTVDVVIPPIETIPDTTSRFFAQNSGNWGYKFLEVDQAESIIAQRATRKVAVFIFDTGGDYDHPNLKPITRWKASYTGEPLIDGHGHSTHVAGTVAGLRNGSAYVGVAEKLREKGLVFLGPRKVLSNSGSGSYTRITTGIKETNKLAEGLIDEGYFVIYNFSLGGGSGNSAFDEALREAEDLGVLISMASNGNNGRELISYPGKSQYTQGIASITTNSKRSSFSNYGPETRFALPGSGIYSTYKNGGYARLSGTSMAAPHAAGVAAILASCFPDANAAQILGHMRKFGFDLGPKGFDKEYGYGAPKLLDLLENPIGDTPPPPPPPNPSPDPDPEPDPDPDPQPTKTQVFEVSKTYSVRWSTMNDPVRQRTPISVHVKYKHNEKFSQAADNAVKTVDDFFTNRGFVLPDGTDEVGAAEWAAYFYRLIMRKNYDVFIDQATITVNDTRFTIDKFERMPKSLRRAKDFARRKNAFTYSFK